MANMNIHEYGVIFKYGAQHMHLDVWAHSSGTIQF